jgi:regulator of replication initiation timing
MRAVLITGVAQYLNLQRTHKQVTAENETLKKENTELKDKWGKIKQASTSRLSESQASPNPAPPKPDSQINTRTSDALDSLAQQVMAERQRVGQS